MHLVPPQKKKGHAIFFFEGGGGGGEGEGYTRCITEDAQIADSVCENVSMLLLWRLFTVV